MAIKTNKVEILDFLFILLMIRILKNITIIENTATPTSLSKSFILATSFALIWAPFIYKFNNNLKCIKVIAKVYTSTIIMAWMN